jgi:hypothetical protein
MTEFMSQHVQISLDLVANQAPSMSGTIGEGPATTWYSTTNEKYEDYAWVVEVAEYDIKRVSGHPAAKD